MMGDTRGQTIQDFAIGMVIFLLVLGYVFAFIPSLFEPFGTQSSSTPVRADRTADYLTQRALAVREPAADGVSVNGGVLDIDCTTDFFSGSHEACPFDSSNLREITGLPDQTTVRVVMYETVADMRSQNPATYSGVSLVVGPEPNVDARQVVRTVRVVTLDGHHYHFVVKIW